MSLAGGPATAQGRSGEAPGKNRPATNLVPESEISSPVTATSDASAPASAANAVIYYGSWLDDASIVAPGDVWVAMSTGYWKADASRQIDAPVISAAIGLNNRMHIGGSVPYYHFQDGAGFSDAGLGNMALYGKFVVIDAAKEKVGVAVTPLLEISPSGEDQIGWALPVNLETRRGSSRFYGSLGYFSRGSVFATIAGQAPVGDRVSLWANFGQSYARAGTHQTSLGVGAFLMLNHRSGIFGGVGRTFQPAELGPGGVSWSGGVSFLLPQPVKP
jgi:hypothetical protein